MTHESDEPRDPILDLISQEQLDKIEADVARITNKPGYQERIDAMCEAAKSDDPTAGGRFIVHRVTLMPE